jgi:hypothetical protein
LAAFLATLAVKIFCFRFEKTEKTLTAKIAKNFRQVRREYQLRAQPGYGTVRLGFGSVIELNALGL